VKGSIVDGEFLYCPGVGRSSHDHDQPNAVAVLTREIVREEKRNRANRTASTCHVVGSACQKVLDENDAGSDVRHMELMAQMPSGETLGRLSRWVH
jgi:hypothetical protein